MHKITFIIVAAFLMISCNGEGSNTASSAVDSDIVKPVSEIKEKGASIHLTKADFLTRVMDYESNPTEWKYEGDLPCIVDFYADWCGPCKIASPVLDELAKEYAGKIYIYKVDTDVEKELASAFGIRSIPSFLFVPQKGQPSMSSGIAKTPAETKEMFRKMIDEFLLAAEEA